MRLHEGSWQWLAIFLPLICAAQSALDSVKAMPKGNASSLGNRHKMFTPAYHIRNYWLDTTMTAIRRGTQANTPP